MDGKSVISEDLQHPCTEAAGDPNEFLDLAKDADAVWQLKASYDVKAPIGGTRLIECSKINPGVPIF